MHDPLPVAGNGLGADAQPGSDLQVGEAFGNCLQYLALAPAENFQGVVIPRCFVSAARFGPVLAGVERRRRSPLEHLEALATGLEGAAGSDTAVELIVGGLRRRLGKSGQLPAHDGREWLGALDLALSSDRGRQAARRLKWIISHPAITCAIPGTGNPKHMKDNLGAGHGGLPDEHARRRMAAHFDAQG